MLLGKTNLDEFAMGWVMFIIFNVWLHVKQNTHHLFWSTCKPQLLILCVQKVMNSYPWRVYRVAWICPWTFILLCKWYKCWVLWTQCSSIAVFEWEEAVQPLQKAKDKQTSSRSSSVLVELFTTPVNCCLFLSPYWWFLPLARYYHAPSGSHWLGQSATGVFCTSAPWFAANRLT